MRNGDIVESGIKFYNPHIKRFPEPRDLYYVEHTGVGVAEGTPFTMYLGKLTLEELRDNFKYRKIDMPPIQGNWDNMQIWIDNMWEAIYNPIWIIILKDKKRKFGVMHGQHRLRLYDAMDANHMWCYIGEWLIPHTPRGWRLTRQDFPKNLQNIINNNSKAPVQGNVSGMCPHCNKYVKYRRWTGKNKLSDRKMFCKKCDGELEYPWSGML